MTGMATRQVGAVGTASMGALCAAGGRWLCLQWWLAGALLTFYTARAAVPAHLARLGATPKHNSQQSACT